MEFDKLVQICPTIMTSQDYCCFPKPHGVNSVAVILVGKRSV